DGRCTSSASRWSKPCRRRAGLRELPAAMADDRRFSERPRDSVRPGEPEAATPPSSRFDNEEFLFHLYRGSELLQDNCVGEAKEELERALSLQPRDAEGQALLGVVYF